MRMPGTGWGGALLLLVLLLAATAVAEERSQTVVELDFESGGFGWWSDTSGAEITNTTAWMGNQSCKFDHQNGSIDHLKLDKQGFAVDDGYVYDFSLAVNISSLERTSGSGDTYLDLLSLRSSSGGPQLNLRAYDNGTLRALVENLSSGVQDVTWREAAWDYDEWFDMQVELDLVGDNASFRLRNETYFATTRLGWIDQEHPSRLLLGEINSDQDSIWYVDHFVVTRRWDEPEPEPIDPGDKGWVGNASKYDELPASGATSFSGTLLVERWGHHAYHFSLDTGDRIDYEIEVSIGGPVDFYIMTEGQYKQYTDFFAFKFGYIKMKQKTFSYSGYHSESGDFVLVVDNDEIAATGATPRSDVVYEISYTVDESFLPGPPPTLVLAALGGVAVWRRRGS